jgi:hypothetical protein
MKCVLLFLVTATAMTGSHSVRAIGADDTTQVVKVRLLNGKTGKPIKNDTPNVWFDDAKDRSNPQTNSNGEVVVSLNDAQFQDLRVLPNLYADCRFKGNSTAGMSVKYSLKEIIATGVVSANVCGKERIEPTPGVLVLYVRPMTFLEKWRL